MDKRVYVERADPDAKGYQEGERCWFNVINRYKWANKYVSGLTIDMPCGMGWGSSLITNAVIVGMDNCREAISRAERLYSDIIFIEGNMLDTGFPSNFWDSIICCEGYEHVSRENQFVLMNEIHRIVKPNGIVLLTTPFVKQGEEPTKNEFHLHEPTIHEVEETIVGKFKVLEMTVPNVARYRLKAIK